MRSGGAYRVLDIGGIWHDIGCQMGAQPVTAPKDVERYRELTSRKSEPYAYGVLLGLKSFDGASLLTVVEKGLAWKAFEHLVENVGLPAEQIARVADLPLRTRARRKVEGRFQPDESDRLLRLARIYGRALDLFAGDRDATLRWLTHKKISLNGRIPLELAKTDVGAREVETTIDRIEQGVYM
jgi:putative toxin-antitoxin system antitoxin component (TIGR02293 family)